MILTETILGVGTRGNLEPHFLKITYTGMFLIDGLANMSMGRNPPAVLLTAQMAFNKGLWSDSVQYNVKK